MVELFTVTTPVALIDTDTEMGLELTVSSRKMTLAGVVMKSPLMPAVPFDIQHD